MKKFILILSLFALSNSFAQLPDTTLVEVVYQFKHMKDTTQPTKFSTENFKVCIGKRYSLFMTGDMAMEDSAMKDIERQFQMQKNSGSNHININTSGFKSVTKNRLYKGIGEYNNIAYNNILNDFYIYTTTKAEFNWQITEELKQIGGFNCQKATTHYKGRDYIAWFTMELPYQTGPWRFEGLPGLILEVYDAKMQVLYLFKEIRKENAIAQNIIILPTIGNKTTQKEFDKIKTEYEKNPQAFINAKLSSIGMGINDGSVKIQKLDDPKKKTSQFNNPIELPEKN